VHGIGRLRVIEPRYVPYYVGIRITDLGHAEKGARAIVEFLQSPSIERRKGEPSPISAIFLLDRHQNRLIGAGLSIASACYASTAG